MYYLLALLIGLKVALLVDLRLIAALRTALYDLALRHCVLASSPKVIIAGL
jgi:hypothetical protein